MLLYGHGLQTWEYGPQFALRSWLFLALHALPGCVAKAAFGLSPVGVYYTIRLFTALLTANANLYLVRRAEEFAMRSMRKEEGGDDAAQWLPASLLLILSLSTGYAQASASFLPTTFAMQCYTVALGGWLQLLSPSQTQAFSRRSPVGDTLKVVFPVAAAVLLGWPFAGLLALPMAIYFVSSVRRLALATVASIVSLALILSPAVALDWLLYCRKTFSAWNIIIYNMLGAHEGRGPELYGVEPWTFFFKNLALNFNFVFIAALGAPVMAWHFAARHKDSRKAVARLLAAAGAPFFLWFGFWQSIPHKEERFMVPAYPFLALSAATSIFLFATENEQRRLVTMRKGLSWRKKLCLLAALLFSAVSLSRTAALVAFYSAPQRVMTDSSVVDLLNRNGAAGSRFVVCVGKEWYRFPTHFFLPPHCRVGFVKTPQFSGALPQLFAEEDLSAPSGLLSQLMATTCHLNPSLNDLNKEVHEQYVANASLQCDALYDSFAADNDQISDDPGALWLHNVVFPARHASGAYRLLDAGRTPGWCRLLYIPFVTQWCAKWRVMDVRPNAISMASAQITTQKADDGADLKGL